MKIQGNNRMNGINPYQKVSQPSVDKTKKTGMGKDELKISPEAQEMLNMSKTDAATQSTSTVSSQQRIQELKDQVSSGTYHVDSRLIADKMYKELKGLQDGNQKS